MLVHISFKALTVGAPKVHAKTSYDWKENSFSVKLNRLPNSPETIIILNHSMRSGATVVAASPSKGYIHY